MVDKAQGFESRSIISIQQNFDFKSLHVQKSACEHTISAMIHILKKTNGNLLRIETLLENKKLRKKYD